MEKPTPSRLSAYIFLDAPSTSSSTRLSVSSSFESRGRRAGRSQRLCDLLDEIGLAGTGGR